MSSQAAKLAYEIGLQKLAPVLQRLFDAEAEITRLKIRIDTVEKASPKISPHLKTCETRKQLAHGCPT